MIAFLTICYAGFYWLFFVKLGLFAKSARNISVFVGVGVVLIGTIVFMWFTYAPTSSDGRMFQYVVQIVPNVRGQVIEVPVEPLTQVARGDVLFRIDPTPYQATVDQLSASIEQTRSQEKRAELEVNRNRELVRQSAAAQRELDRWTADLEGTRAAIRSLQAQLRRAEWELGETEVRAPYSGEVFNLQVRPGTYVTNVPLAAAMTFISDEIRAVVASFSQSASRRMQIGDDAEVVFVNAPGRVLGGKVIALPQATGTAQMTPSGQIPVFTGTPSVGRYLAVIELNDREARDRIPQGAGGTVAVYTRSGKPVHIISKVVMRMHAWLAYLTSP